MNLKTKLTLIPTLLCSALFMTNAARADTSSAKPRIIAIAGNDSMRYDVTEIKAKPGELLEVVLTNVGQLPKQTMAHNWVLLKPMTDSEVAAFASSAISKAPEYLPDDKSAILAHTKSLGPKQTDTVDFSAPATAGEYPFICTFPGHFALMRGKLIVK